MRSRPTSLLMRAIVSPCADFDFRFEASVFLYLIQRKLLWDCHACFKMQVVCLGGLGVASDNRGMAESQAE